MPEVPLPVSAFTNRVRKEPQQTPDVRVTYRVFSPPTIYLLDHFFVGKPPLKVIEVFGGHHGWPMVYPQDAAQMGWNALRRLAQTH